jgi:hypothetical protein
MRSVDLGRKTFVREKAAFEVLSPDSAGFDGWFLLQQSDFAGSPRILRQFARWKNEIAGSRRLSV